MSKKIAIIGGGVVGSTSAFYLSRRSGIEVTLFDETTGQATSASAGIISPWLSKRRNKEWYQLVKLGAAFYPKFLQHIFQEQPIPKEVYQQVGTLLFTKKDKNIDELLEIGLKRREEAPEIGELKILKPEEIRERISIYSKNKRALFASGGARVDGKALIQAILKAATQPNANILNEKASLLKSENNKWLVQTASTSQEFDAVILANSAWLPETLEPFGYEVDVRPQKGQLAELQTNWATDNWPVIMPTGEKDIIPFLDGKVLVGATHEDDEGFDLTLEESSLEEMVLNAQEQFSDSISTSDIISGRVGTRAYTSDFAPFFGKVPELENVFVASGLGSTGLTAGPLLGKILSDLVLGETPVLDQKNYPIENYVIKNIKK